MKKNMEVPDAVKFFDDLDEEVLSDVASSSDEDNIIEVVDDDDGESDADNDEIIYDANIYIYKDRNEMFSGLAKTAAGSQHRSISTCSPIVEALGDKVKNPLDVWKLYFTDKIIERIMQFTNMYVSEVEMPKYSRQRDVKEVTHAEIEAMIGLLYLGGIMRSSHPNLEDLWSKDGTGIDIFPASMSLKRFRFLLKCIQFDNMHDRKQRKQTDRIAPIQELFTEFTKACEDHYILSEYVTIGELCEGFRGNCSFRVYFNNKSTKCGIKIYALVDSKTFYVSSLKIYAGKKSKGQPSDSLSDYVNCLVKRIVNTGRNVTISNNMLSLNLAKKLLKENLTTIGALNKNEIPSDFHPTKEAGESILYKNMMLISYKPKQNKVGVLLSTLHGNDKYVSDKIGEVISLYDLTKGCVDFVDEIKQGYSVSRISNRWPLTIFFSMLNIAGINCHILCQNNSEEKIGRRHFLKQLGLSLIQKHLKDRANVLSLPVPMKRKISDIRGEAGASNLKGKILCFRKERCAYCCARKNRKTKQQCRKCHEYICREHTYSVCIECSLTENNDNSMNEML